MIRSVTIDNLLGKVLTCELANPWAHGLNITDISGISPEDTNIVTQDLALLDGSVYSSSRAPERTITISFKYAPGDGDIEHARHNMYEMFSLGRFNRLYFRTDENTLWIDGIVKDMDADIFSNRETASVTLICPDPWFRSSTVEKVVQFTHINECNAFEFPLEAGYDPEDRVQFGEYDGRYAFKDSTVFRIFNPGHRDIGCVIRAMRTSIGEDPIKLFHISFKNITLNELSMANLNPDPNTKTEDLNYLEFNWGDVYEMNSIPGYKMINFYKYQINSQIQATMDKYYGRSYPSPCPMDDAETWDSMDRNSQMQALERWKIEYEAWRETFYKQMYPDGTLVNQQKDGKVEKAPLIPPNLYTITKHLNMFAREYKWFRLRKGWNDIDVSLKSGNWGESKNEVPNFEISIEFEPLYEGV